LTGYPSRFLRREKRDYTADVIWLSDAFQSLHVEG
jgi:hypothetical protein